MKQYILRHEKAFSMTFRITHIILQVLSFLFVSAVAITGIHYAMMHYKFPVTSEKANEYITSFIQLWLSLAMVIFTIEVILRYTIGYWNSIIEILKKSLLLGLAGQTMLFCLYYCYLGNVSLATSCFWYFMIEITLENLRKMFIEKVDRAKWEQRLRCLQCLRMIAENHNAAIER